MKCVICDRDALSKVIDLQSTPHGLVCPQCIYDLVEDALIRIGE
jgi:hypothetical protein